MLSRGEATLSMQLGEIGEGTLGIVHNFVFVFFLLSLILENSQSQNQTMKGKSGIRQCRSTIHLLAGLQAIALGTDAIRLGAETDI